MDPMGHGRHYFSYTFSMCLCPWPPQEMMLIRLRAALEHYTGFGFA
jgi:hypothetical protein